MTLGGSVVILQIDVATNHIQLDSDQEGHHTTGVHYTHHPGHTFIGSKIKQIQ